MKFANCILFVCCLTLVSLKGFAQTAAKYIFSASKEPFNYLTGATNVPSIQTYGDISPVIPIGFVFNFAGGFYTDVVVSTEGWISFNTAVLSTNSQSVNNLSALADIMPAIFPLWDNLTGATGNSGIQRIASYSLTGVAPNRIFSFEWRNWHRQSDDVSFQVRLFETTNVIKFSYKEEILVGPDSTQSSTIGIAGSSLDFLSLSDQYDLPIASPAVFSTEIVSAPISGQVYTFTPPQMACGATPDPGDIALQSPFNICASGTVVNLIDTGYSELSGLNFQWQSSINSGISWSDIAGATNYYYQPIVNSNIQFRAKVTCVSSTLASLTLPVTISVGGPQVYNTLPYFQDFECWQSFCSDRDVPASGWQNNPSFGNPSWRREDQGCLGFWTHIDHGFYLGTSYSPVVSGTHCARFSSVNVSSGIPGDLDLFLDCSAQSNDKGLYFYYRNNHVIQAGRYDQDSLRIYLSTNGGSTFTHLASLDTANWRKYYLPLTSNSPNTVVRFQGVNADSLTSNIIYSDKSDIALDSVYIALPCSGMPSAGYITGPVSQCPGNKITLTSMGASIAGDLTYQWEYSVNNGSSWSAYPGENDLSLIIPALYDTTLFRMKLTCNNAGLTAYSNVLTINVQTPLGNYAAIPFEESFEEWMNQCDSLDVPGANGLSNWSNSPSQGASVNNLFQRSWRRDDQIGVGNSLHVFSDGYSPVSVDKFHSARFPAFQDSYASLDVLVDCSGSTGSNEVQFYLNMLLGISGPPYDVDSIKVFLSTNGGLSFDRIGSFRGTTGWSSKKLLFNSTASKTVLRFAAIMPRGEVNNTGLDRIRVMSLCGGQPVAGSIDSLTTCAGKNFYLQMSGGSNEGGLSYRWQKSINGNNWSNIGGDTTPMVQHSIVSDTWYRCILKCNASGLSDTTAPRLIAISPFYYCYCDASGVLGYEVGNIGNVSITDSLTSNILLDNGVAYFPPPYPLLYIAPYSNFQGLIPSVLYRDSTYLMEITEQPTEPDPASYPYFIRGKAATFIDFNRDGVYDPVSERVFAANYAGDAEPTDSCFFHVPVNGQIGLTGMRCILNYGTGSMITYDPMPCDFENFWGEVEDYIVSIEYAPCNGSLNAGISIINDTLVLAGNAVQLMNTTHDDGDLLQVSQLLWLWQYSLDSLSWTDIPGSELVDTLSQNVTQKTWFRLKMICQFSGDTTYSNAVYSNVEGNIVKGISGVNSLNIFPNPTDGWFTIKYEGAFQSQLVVRLTDLYGKELFRKTFRNVKSGFSTSIFLNDYAKGLYLLNVRFDHDQTVKSIFLK